MALGLVNGGQCDFQLGSPFLAFDLLVVCCRNLLLGFFDDALEPYSLPQEGVLLKLSSWNDPFLFFFFLMMLFLMMMIMCITISARD